MIAGRSMPGRVLSTKRAVAISAPVLPALTQASASPPLTRSMATRIEESFLPRSAVAGDSSMPTTWEVWWIRSRSPKRATPPPHAASSAALSPTSTRLTSA